MSDLYILLQNIGYNDGYDSDGFPLAGSVLRAIRLKRKLKQEEMAKLLGIERALLAKMEKNERSINFISRRKFAKALGILPIAFGLADNPMEVAAKPAFDTSFLKTTLNLHREVYFAGGNTGGLQTANQSIATIHQISQGLNHSDRNLLSILCQYNQLAMDIAREERDLGAINRYAHNALDLARTINDPAMEAATQLRHCAALYDAGDLAGALLIAEQVLQLEGKIPTSLMGSVYIEVVRPFARVNNKRAVKLAEKAVSIARVGTKEDVEGTFTRLTLEFTQMRHAYTLIEGQPEEALEILDVAEDRTDRKLQRRLCGINVMQAKAYLRLGQHENAARVAQDALKISRTINSAPSAFQVSQIHRQLLTTKAARNQEVVLLGKQL